MNNNELYNLTNDLAFKFLGVAEENGKQVYKYDAVSGSNPDTTLFSVSSDEAINNDNINKNKLITHISNSLSGDMKTSEVSISKSDIKDMIKVPYKKDTKKIFKLTDGIAVKEVECVTINGEKIYKYEAVSIEDTTQTLFTIYSPKKLQDGDIDKNKISKHISDIFNANPKTTEIYLKDSDIKTMKDDNRSKKQKKKGGLGINIVDLFKFDAGKKIINNLSSGIDDLGFSKGNYNSLSDTISDVPGKYAYLGEMVTSALKGVMGNGGFSIADIIANTNSVINEQFSIIFDIVSSSTKMRIETGEILPDIDGIMDGETEEEYKQRFRTDYKNTFSERKFNSFTEYFEAYNNFIYDYTVYSADEVKNILDATELTDLEGLSDEDIETHNQLLEMRNSIAELVGARMGLEGQELEKFMMANSDIITSAINDTNILNDSNSSIKEFLFKMEDEYYSSVLGQKALLDKCIQGSNSAYDEFKAIGYTNYIKYCMERGKEHQWLMKDLRPLANIVSTINGNKVFSVNTEIIDKDLISKYDEYYQNEGSLPYNILKIDGKYYQRNYTQQGEDMLYYMDYHWGENKGNTGENKIITAFSNQGYIDAVERNYKGLWLENHKDNKDAERDYYILNGVVKDKQRYDELKNAGEFSFEELINYVNQVGIDSGELLNGKFVDENGNLILENIKDNESKFYDFKVDNIFESLPSTAITGVIQLASGIAKFGENLGDAINMAVHSDFFLTSTIDGNGNLYFDIQDLLENNQNYNELVDSCWNELLNNKELYDEQFNSFSSSQNAYNMALKWYEKLYYNSALGKFMGPNGGLYYSIDEIPAGELQKEIDRMMPELFKMNKISEWNLNDSSSSSQYLATFKLGIRNSGDFTEFNNLSKDIIEKAEIQFDTMNKVAVDNIGNFMNEKIYSKEWYDALEASSFIKHDNILGMTVNQVGNMAIPVLSSMIPGVGPALSSGLLFTSAFGGASEEAINSGAGYNDALAYATLSATTEILIEKAFSGIAGFGEGWMDNLLNYIPNKLIDKFGLTDNLLTQSIKKLVVGGIGEGIEEVTTDLVTPLWQSLTYMSDKTYYQIVSENVSLESLAQTFAVSFLSSFVFGTSEVVKKSNSFESIKSSLTEKVNELANGSPEVKALLETELQGILAEWIGGIIEDNDISKSGVFEQLVDKLSTKIMQTPEGQKALEELQTTLQEVKNAPITIKVNDKEISLTRELLMQIEDITGYKGSYEIKDGEVIFNGDEKTKFLDSMYKIVSNQYVATNSSIKKNIEFLENSKGNPKNINIAVSLLVQSGKYNLSDIISKKVSFDVNGNKVIIPKGIAEKLSTKIDILEDGTITFKKDMDATKFLDIIYDKAIKVSKDALSKNNYDLNKLNPQNNNIKGQLNLVSKVKDIVKTTFKSNESFVVTRTQKLDNADLVKHDIIVDINGKKENISIYVDSNTNVSVYEDSRVKDKITEIIRKTKNVNKDTKDVYIGEIKVDKLQQEVVVTQNEKNQSYVDTINTTLLGSAYVIAASPIKTVFNTATMTTVEEDIKKDEGKNIDTTTVNVDANNLNVFDFGKIKLQIDSYIEKIKKQVTEYVSKHRSDIDFVSKFEKYKNIERVNFNIKLNEVRQTIVVSYEKVIGKIEADIEKVRNNESLKAKYEKLKEDIVAKYNSKIETIITDSRAMFETIINSAMTIKTEVSQLEISSGIKNKHNSMNPNKAVNRFANQIQKLSKILESKNINSILETYVKNLEVSKNIKVTEELIGKLDLELTDVQKQQFVSIFEEIGSFVISLGIKDDNLVNFYNAITMEEKPSKIIKNEISDERKKKFKDKKLLAKNVVIASVVAYTSNPMSLVLYDQLYKYVEIRKRTGTITENTMLGKALESKLGKFVDNVVYGLENGKKFTPKNTVVNKLNEYVASKGLDDSTHFIDESVVIEQGNDEKILSVEDVSLYDALESAKLAEGISTREFLTIVKNYIDGKDISVKLKNQENLEVLERYSKEKLREWYEEESKKLNKKAQNLENKLSSMKENTVLPTELDIVPNIEKFNKNYASVPTTTLIEFIKLDIEDIGRVFFKNESFNRYDNEEILEGVVELYNYSKSNNINININPNLEHFINEYQTAANEKGNELLNIDNALYNMESIISVPKRILTPSFRSISVYDLVDIIMGKKDISAIFYSEIDLYEATKKLVKYFEGKNISIDSKLKIAFDIVKSVDDNSTIINFIDVLNGKEKIILPTTIKGTYGNSNISDVISYLDGKSRFISTGVIESLKEYINTNNVNIPGEMMDKINLLVSLGQDNILLNDVEYLKGKANPIIVPTYLDGVYTRTSNIYNWITGSDKLYNVRTIDEIIKLTKKFTEYIYSNNIVLDNSTMAKLEVLKDLKPNETIINLQEFFNGDSAIIVNNSINVNGKDIKLSTVIDTVNLTSDLHIKILSGQNIDGLTRENIFDAIEELYKQRPELMKLTQENYEKIKDIYNNNYILENRYLLPKTFNGIRCENIVEILYNPIKIEKYTVEERKKILDSINAFVEHVKNETSKFIYNEIVKMRDNLVELMSREIPKVNISENIYSELYYMFENSSQNGGTFGTDQGIIRHMLQDLRIKDAIKALFYDKSITDDKFLKDLQQLEITKSQLEQTFNDLFWNPNGQSVIRLINIINNNEVIKLVQKNFPGMNGIEAIRFLYLVETAEAGNNGVCNYAAAVNMIFNKYLGKETQFEKDFGYPMYVTLQNGKKVLNDAMLLVDMYSTINKGVLVKEFDGKYEIATTNQQYLNLSDVGRFQMEYLQKFIDAKGIDLGLNETFYYSSLDNSMWKNEIIKKIKESLENGEYINISGAGFDLLYKDGSVALKNCGGHIMTAVGLTADGKIIVDSWGKELFIDLDTTMQNIGEEVKIDNNTVIRRLAVAAYELGDKNVNNDTNSNNNSSNQELEQFDIMRDVEILDESNVNTDKSRRNFEASSTKVSDVLSKSQKHLVYGDGINVRSGIRGAHSIEYFMNLFNKTFDDVRNLYKVQYGDVNKVIYLSLGEKIPHSSIEGVWDQQYYYEFITNKGVEIRKMPKTLVDNVDDLLKWQSEAINNSELLEGNNVAYGMSNNGLWFRYFSADGNAFPFMEFTEKFINPIIRDSVYKIKVPILKEGTYITVDVTIDVRTSPKVLEHGPELIKLVQGIVDKNSDLYNKVINLGEVIFDEKSQTMEIKVLEKFDIPVEIDEIVEDLEPLIIEDSKRVNGSNESSQNAKRSDVVIPQIKNVKQLAIIERVKYVIERANDKFIDYRINKLNNLSYYDRTIKTNNELFKQGKINKIFRDFANNHLIDLQALIKNGLLKNPRISEINSLISNNRILFDMEQSSVSIADVLGTKKKIDLDRNFNSLFSEGNSEYQTRNLGLLQYTNDQILNVLAESFKIHPLVISEVDTGKYIIEDNGYHRYSLLRLHYLNEYIKVKDNPDLVNELNKKYTIPVNVYKLDYVKTYCTTILNELGINLEVKIRPVTKKSIIYINGKKVNMNEAELIEFTRNKIKSVPNGSEIIRQLCSKSESFREFYNKYLKDNDVDYGIDFNEVLTTQTNEILVDNKAYSLETIEDILSNRYLEIFAGKTIDGINSKNIFSIINKMFEDNPDLKVKYKTNYDKIIDIFKNNYVHETGNLYPKTFNGIKTEEIVEVLKQPYKLQKYGNRKRNQICSAINEYSEYSISNNYDIPYKEIKGYMSISKLMNRDVPNVKLYSEIRSRLLDEFRRNEMNGSSFGSKQGIIRLILEKNGVTDAIKYLFNKNISRTKFLEEIKDITDEEFQELLDDIIDETGKLDGIYDLYEHYELFEIIRNNFGGIEDFEIIKFLYLFESIEAGAKGICNYSTAVNMIFNKYLGKEAQFESDFGYPMYIEKNGKKVLNDTILLADMYSIINKDVFIREVDGKFKVVATSNKDYLRVTKVGGSFNIENLQKFLDVKSKQRGRKIDLNLSETFKFDSRTDVMWREEIILNVKNSLEKGETINLSAAGFDLYWKDGKRVAAKDYDGHVMTVVGLTKDGNLIVDSHGKEMIVNLDLCLENAGKPYIGKNKKIINRRIGITAYSFDGSIPSSNKNEIIDDDNGNTVQDEGIFDLFKKSSDIELFEEMLSTGDISALSDGEISIMVDYIKKGKIKLKTYNLNSETIGILIDKVPLQKIYPLSNVKAVKTFIEYFGIDTLIKFNHLNNNFLLGNNGENLYNLFDYYDLSIPRTNETDKLKELDNLITNAINGNKKTEYKTYTFNYSGLINTEYAKTHPELFLEDSAPQDLKDAFYSGRVNSANEYNLEWSKYLEGKSVKGVIHEELISSSDAKVVENINILGENSSKYNEALRELSSRVGLTVQEVQEILSSKMKYLIENSEFGIRRTMKSLESILEIGKIKNQFETNQTTYGVNNTDMRMDMEKDLFGIPGNVRYQDRPIYGMLLPKNMSSKYVEKGPGSYYSGDGGVIYVFDKTKIKNNATITLGDSLDQAGKICATTLSNPKYFGMFSEMLSTIKTKDDLLNFDFTSLYEKSILEVGNAAYYEFQLHGEESHTLDNLKEIVFLKMPESKIIEKLKELNIKWKVIN